jgi:hypothetical protein
MLAALLVCLFAAGASADVIYKVRLKDGSIAFTDRPPPGATVLEKREFEAAPPSSATTRKFDGAAVDERLRKRAAENEKNIAAVADAERALAEARTNLEKGREPREGDFIGTARRGFVRQSPAFEERVQALEKAVADAEARLAKAIATRDAAR